MEGRKEEKKYSRKFQNILELQEKQFHLWNFTYLPLAVKKIFWGRVFFFFPPISHYYDIMYYKLDYILPTKYFNINLITDT